MGLFDALKSFTRSVNAEYDRRIREASLVKEYDPTGAHHHHGAHDTHHDTHAERLQGEGGAVGQLQSNAGPQLNGERVPENVPHH